MVIFLRLQAVLHRLFKNCQLNPKDPDQIKKISILENELGQVQDALKKMQKAFENLQQEQRIKGMFVAKADFTRTLLNYVTPLLEKIIPQKMLEKIIPETSVEADIGMILFSTAKGIKWGAKKLGNLVGLVHEKKEEIIIASLGEIKTVEIPKESSELRKDVGHLLEKPQSTSFDSVPDTFDDQTLENGELFFKDEDKSTKSISSSKIADDILAELDKDNGEEGVREELDRKFAEEFETELNRDYVEEEFERDGFDEDDVEENFDQEFEEEFERDDFDEDFDQELDKKIEEEVNNPEITKISLDVFPDVSPPPDNIQPLDPLQEIFEDGPTDDMLSQEELDSTECSIKPETLSEDDQRAFSVYLKQFKVYMDLQNKDTMPAEEVTEEEEEEDEILKTAELQHAKIIASDERRKQEISSNIPDAIIFDAVTQIELQPVETGEDRTRKILQGIWKELADKNVCFKRIEGESSIPLSFSDEQIKILVKTDLEAVWEAFKKVFTRPIGDIKKFLELKQEQNGNIFLHEEALSIMQKNVENWESLTNEDRQNVFYFCIFFYPNWRETKQIKNAGCLQDLLNNKIDVKTFQIEDFMKKEISQILQFICFSLIKSTPVFNKLQSQSDTSLPLYEPSHKLQKITGIDGIIE